MKHSDEDEKYYCKLCKESLFPFQKLSDDEYFTSIIKNIDVKEDLNLRISPSSSLKTLFTDFSNQNQNDDECTINCDYYDISAQIPFALDVSSLGLHKDYTKMNL